VGGVKGCRGVVAWVGGETTDAAEGRYPCCDVRIEYVSRDAHLASSAQARASPEVAHIRIPSLLAQTLRPRHASSSERSSLER
jgi:hypothetical protein